MRKIIEKHGMLKCIGALMDLIGIILLAVSYFVDATTPDMVLKIMGIDFLIIGIYLLMAKSLKEKLTTTAFIGSILVALSILLFAPINYVLETNPNMILKIISLTSFIVGGLMISINSDDHRLSKSIFVFVLATILFT